MQKKRIFISSVQSEFVAERQMLFEYLTTVEQCLNNRLKRPQFVQNVDFSVILYRPDSEITEQVTGQVTGQATGQVTGQVTEKIIKLLKILNNQMLSLKEMMQYLSLSGRNNFLKEYLHPAIEQGFVAMKFPQSPNHPNQRYYLTQKGLEKIQL